MIFTLLTGFWLVIDAADANTRIEGYFSGVAGEEIRLMKYADLMSYREVEVDAQLVDTAGYFVFEPGLDEPRLMFFRYRHGRRYIYLEPGQYYNIHFDATGPDGQEGSFRSMHPMHQRFQVEIVLPEPEEHLHGQLTQMDNMVADYLQTHVRGRPRASHRESLRQFSVLADTLLSDDDPFFDAYKRYYIGYLEATLRARSFRDVVEEYILSQPVLYRNPMYMNLFNALFGKYVFTGSRSITRGDLHAAVNTQASYHAMMDTLDKDTLLVNEQLRELVMLASLQEMLHISEYANSQVMRVLQEIAEFAQFEKHRLMASNILYQYKRFKSGFPAPELVLKEDHEVIFNLQEEKGKYVYLFFWASWCPVSMSEVSAMARIAADFDDHVSVIGIMVDEEQDLSPVYAEAADESLPFRIFHYGGDYRMLESYGVRTIPQYMLIDPQGHVYEYPFAAPSSGISDRLKRIITR